MACVNLIFRHEWVKPINGQSCQKQPHNFNDSLQAKAKSGKYLMEKYQLEQYLQLSLKYFVKSFSI